MNGPEPSDLIDMIRSVDMKISDGTEAVPTGTIVLYPDKAYYIRRDGSMPRLTEHVFKVIKEECAR